MLTVKRAIFIGIILWLLTTNALAQQPHDDSIATLMGRMSVEDKVGQLFIVSFVGADTNPDSDIWQLVTEYRAGGVILLAANSNFNNDASAPRQIAELTNSLKTHAFNTNGLPLFIALDHEGDNFPYTRITEGVTPLPSPMAIGATWDTANAEAIGEIVGEEVAAMGINLLLGPSLDVLNNPRPTGRGDIGIRVFGGDPYWVSQMGRAYIRGVHLGSGGRVATVAKHFPGHGNSDRLPDNEIATVDKSLQELRRIELPPFFYTTADLPDDPLGATDALMTSHIRYRGFQGDIRHFTAPISFDAEGMKALFSLPEVAPWREQGGLVVSDALGVPAVRKYFDPSLETFPHRRIAKEAFLAGNDVLSLVQFDSRSIWSVQLANIKDTIYFFRTEYLNNPTFAAQVDGAVKRILRAKLKLYPEWTLEALTVNPQDALAVGARPRPIINAIARQSLSLLYPSPSELRQLLPQPPRPDETILIITDVRLARECYTSTCQPKELLLSRTVIAETILRLYGPGATGQIQPEQISSMTFTELKLALGGSMALPTETITGTIEVSSEPPAQETPAAAAENPLLQLSAEEVRRRIGAADWLIFAALDLNTVRYSESDALRLFLAQESGALRDKATIVLAFNAPYYLDTTEVRKLTAYYGLYSKTTPHIEAAVRALFGEIEAPGRPPVSVEGIGYDLVEVLSPAGAQAVPLRLEEVSPESRVLPVTVAAHAGPIVDHNGHLVPDDTPIEIRAMIEERVVATRVAYSRDGLIEAALTLTEPGETAIVAVAGEAVSERIFVSVLAPTPTPTLTPTPTATPTPTPSPTPTAPPASAPPTPETAGVGLRHLDGVDLLSALNATMLAGLLGFWLGQHAHKPLTYQVRAALLGVVGGLIAYLLYGVGLLRPELLLFEAPEPLVGRLTVAGLAFVFGLVTMILGSGS